MKREIISQGIGNISDRYIQEAADYTFAGKHEGRFKRTIMRSMAAVIVLAVLVSGIFISLSSHHGVITVYAYETNEEITAAGAVLHTGRISDTGEMKGHPLMFYLTGPDIATVRFSCKNQELYFMDWTEKRDEYGNAQNFTVAYGKDEREYYYLTIEWIPDAIIRELTDNADSRIAALPEELREDIIVMEITFGNGKTATKAITISLQDDGTFFAILDDYRIKDSDTFVKRPDSLALRDIPAPENIIDGDTTITFTGTIIENTIDTTADVVLVKPMGDEIPYNAIFFELPDEETEWVLRIGTVVTIVCKNDFTEEAPHFGTLISITADVEGEPDATLTPEQIEAAKQAALAYYEGTVFSVNAIKYFDGKLSYGEEMAGDCNFIVNVSKGGIVQEPDRTISLRLGEDGWIVVNEGY